MYKYEATIVNNVTNDAISHLCVIADTARGAADVAHELFRDSVNYGGVKIITIIGAV